MRELLRHTLRALRARPSRSLFTAFGIAAGVALFVAIRIINESTLDYFADGVRAMGGKAHLSVTGVGGGFPAETLGVVRGVAGVKHAVPALEIPAYVPIAGLGDPGALLIIGVDAEFEPLVRQYRLIDVGDPSARLSELTGARSVLITRDYADSHHLDVGARVAFITQSGTDSFVIRGVLDPLGAAAAAGGKLAIMGLGEAQNAFGMEGKLTRIDIVAADAGQVNSIAASLERVLGPGYRVERPESGAMGVDRMVQGYQALLSFLSLLALAIGGLVLANTVSILALEQRREIGILRAIGASRTMVFWLCELQALLLGGAGAIVGALLGRGLAEGLVSGVSRSLSNQYLIPIDITRLHYSLAQATVDFAMATGFALICAVWGAWRASRIAPMAAIQAPQIGSGNVRARWVNIGGAAGALLFAYLAVVISWQFDRDSPAWQTTNAGIGFVAALCLTPWLIGFLVRRLLGPVQSLAATFAPAVQLALGSLSRRPRWSGATGLMLGIGLLLVVTVSVVHDSFKETLQRWLDRVLYADLIVSSAGRLLRMQVQPLSEDVASLINAVRGVHVVDGYGAMGVRNLKMEYQGREIVLKAFDRPHPAMTSLPFDFVGSQNMVNGGNIYRSGSPTALVSGSFARNFDKRAGDTLIMNSPTGPVAFTVLGEVNDYAVPDGVVYIARDIYKRHWRDAQVTFFAVMVEPGVSASEVHDRINNTLGVDRGIVASLNRDLRRQMHEILDESFAYTRAIEAAALIVGLLGLANAMATSVGARRREFAVLRAVGMSAAMLRRMVMAEAVVQSVLAAFVAVACGLILAYLCLTGVVTAATGWRIEFHPHWRVVATVGLIGLIFGILGSLLPAADAARLPIREGLSYE